MMKKNQKINWTPLFFLLLIIISFSFAQQADAYSYEYQNPLEHTSFTDLIYGFLSGLQTIIGLITVIMIVIGGVVYITSSGKTAQMEKAKNIVIYALIGFATVVAAPTLLLEIKDIVSSNSQTNATIIEDAKSVPEIITGIMQFILIIFGILAVLSFVFSGITYITSVGNTSKADQAKKILLYSIIGVAIASSALILLQEITKIISP